MKKKKPSASNRPKKHRKHKPRTIKETPLKNPTVQELEKRGMRLNKYVSNSGVCSRRKADELIKEGKVSVNDKVVVEMGFKVQQGDVVKYNGKTLHPQKKTYIILNKPKNIITTTNDPQGRLTVMDIVRKASPDRLYPVGRLDRATTGLLVLTNDGELAQKLMHPSFMLKKIYHVFLDKPLTKNDFQKIVEGITLEDGAVEIDDLAYPNIHDRREVGIEIHIGRNRIVRRLFEHFGYEVKRLDRVMYGPLTKKDLPRGRWRHLSQKEVILLKHFQSQEKK